MSHAPAALSDQEAVNALAESGIPAAYFPKSRALSTLEPQWPEVAEATHWVMRQAAEFAEFGRGIEIAFDGRIAYDFSYLLARAMVLRAVSVHAISLPTLKSLVERRFEPDAAEALSQINQAKFLLLVGAFGPGEPPYARTPMFEVEWFLRQWMLNGRSLIIQGEGRVADCQWWSAGLRSLFAERLGIRFEGPPIHLDPREKRPAVPRPGSR